MPTIFESYILQNQSYLKSFALRLTNDREEAKDLFQDTCLSAWRFFHHFEEGTNIRAWLATIMKNQFTNGYRAKRRAPDRANLDMNWMQDFGPSSEAKEGEYSDSVVEALSSLSRSQKNVFILTCVLDYSYEETSAITGIKLGTIRSTLFKGRKILKDSLQNNL